jgi:prepilin-type N-terminal cleavage/methylation domain-containing protein
MKNERGFTLIELLVVIAILAVLFGVTALALNGVGSNAEANAAKGELDVVQTAIDTYLGVNAGTSTTVSGAGTCTAPGPATADFGTYLRRTSLFYYKWNANGNITEQWTDSACSGGTQYYP